MTNLNRSSKENRAHQEEEKFFECANANVTKEYIEHPFVSKSDSKARSSGFHKRS